MAEEIKRFGFPAPKAKEIELECPKHGKVRTEAFRFGSGEFTATCPICEKEQAEKEAAEQRAKEAERERILFEKDKIAKNIEKEYWGKTFDDFKVFTDSQGEALRAVKNLVEQKHGKVLLLGNNGSGKTMLGSIAVDMLGGKILSMYEISTMIRQSYTVKATVTELEIVTELASIPMLVIDEMGRTKGSEAELNWLSFVLDKRHVRGLPFMLLSNDHLKKDCKKGGCDKCFESRVDNDVLSRLRQDSKIIKLYDAPDYRARGYK